jgi:hypothetical protein
VRCVVERAQLDIITYINQEHWNPDPRINVKLAAVSHAVSHSDGLIAGVEWQMSWGFAFRSMRRLSVVVLISSVAPNAGFAGDAVTYRIGGTGMALKAMRLLGNDFSAIVANSYFDILPSLGTSGGIRALTEGAIDVALAAREPTPQESAMGVEKSACRAGRLFVGDRRSACAAEQAVLRPRPDED